MQKRSLCRTRYSANGILGQARGTVRPQFGCNWTCVDDCEAAVPVIMIATTSHKAASERPACEMLELAPLVAVDVVDATERVELFDRN